MNPVSSSMHHHVWVCLGMFGYVWVCLGMFGYVWICLGRSDVARLKTAHTKRKRASKCHGMMGGVKHCRSDYFTPSGEIPSSA